MPPRYSYTVLKWHRIPLHCIYIQSETVHGVYVYGNSEDAQDDISDIEYDLDIPDGIAEAYTTADSLFTRIIDRYS